MRDDFAIFICTHGRPDKQLTLKALLESNYTGKYYLVLDDTDKTIQRYIDNYGADKIIVFDKNHYINTVDTASNNPSYKCILYAKCAVEDIAKELNLSCFVIADDDLITFYLRWAEGKVLRSSKIYNMDKVLENIADFVIENNTTLVGIGHGGIYFEGASVMQNSNIINLCSPYNFIVRNTKCPVSWTSWFGEDDVTTIFYSSRGHKVLLLPQMQLVIVPSGSEAEAGMQEVYQNNSRFTLMFYIFMHNPTGIDLTIKTDRKTKVWRWDILRRQDNVHPRIISSKYKKG